MLQYGPNGSCLVQIGPIWSILALSDHMVPYSSRLFGAVAHGPDLSCLVLFGPVWSNFALGVGLKKSCMLSIEYNGSNWSCLFLIGPLYFRLVSFLLPHFI